MNANVRNALYYLRTGIWNPQVIHNLVEIGWYTAEDYEQILGYPYQKVTI